MVFSIVSSVGDDVKWQSAIERALGTWESVVEWADYISFLARVQKAVKNKQRCDGSQLPLASQISEMLAMCLDPALPAGVHQMCIDVYDTTFSIIGPQRLSETINIWLPGLLPVVSWSAFNVKPLVLNLFKKHIVAAVMPHPTELKELYRPLLLALLPSIEDESADCFSEICELISGLKNKQLGETSDGEFFWRCFYLCILTSPDSRLGALTFIHKNEPYLDKTGFLVRAVCCGLEDSNVLVQRGFLDLLTQYLPLDSPVLQRENDRSGDFDKLILSACRTILRKDMSLNRRLRLWLLGPDPDSVAATQSGSDSLAVAEGKMSRFDYLKKYAAKRLTDVMLKELERDPVTACLISQGLTDRWELGAVLAPAMLTPLLLCSRSMETVPKAFLNFFDNIDCTVVWSTAISLLKKDPDAVLFMINHYNISDQEMLTVHIPLFVLYVLSISSCSGATTNDDNEEQRSAVVAALLKILPPQELPTPPVPASNVVDFAKEVPKYMTLSYELTLKGEEPPSLPVAPKNISWWLVKMAGDVFLKGGSANLLNLVLKLIPETPGLTVDLPQSEELISCLHAESIGGVELFTHLKPVMAPLQIMKYVESFVADMCSNMLSDGYKQVEKVQDLWQINDVCGGLVVSSALSRVLADRSRSAFDRARIYVGIWSYSVDQHDIASMLTKPTLLFLDIAFEDKALFGAYLQSGVVRTGTAQRFIKLLVDKLDIEATQDQKVLSYVLERFIVVLENHEIKSTYISKFAPLVSTLILEWFDRNALTKSAYSFALEIAELTVLDRRIKDGKVWLRRFCDALINSYIEQRDTGDESGEIVIARNDKDTDATSNSANVGGNEDLEDGIVPVSLMRFITAAVPLLEQKDDIRVFAEVCVRSLNSEVDYEGYGQLLQALLHASPAVEEGLLQCIVVKLTELDGPLINSNADGVGANSGILHLLSAVELIIISGLKYVKEHHSQHAPSVGGLTGAIAGFHLESPEDRSMAIESEEMLSRCIQVAIQLSCKYWQFLQQARQSSNFAVSSSSTIVHTTGRLKTRLRKLMFICHSARPAETLTGVAACIGEPAKAVRMIHMFEGSRQKVTLELLFKLALENESNNMMMFDVTAEYINSLENDLLSDIWQQLQGFLTAAASQGGVLQATKTLNFIVNVIVPRLDFLKLKANKRYVNDFSNTYVKLLLASDTNDALVLQPAIEKLPAVVSEQESQGQLLSKVLSSVIRNPREIARHSKLFDVVTSTFNIAGSAPAKVWARQFGDFILEAHNENEVVPMDLQQSLDMMPVVNAWVSCDKERVREFVGKIATYGASNVLFGWSGTQAVADANLRRLAYMVISSTQSNLSLNFSKLTNQLAALWTQNAESVCFLLRACLLSELSSTLMSFLTFRLQSIFRDALSRKEPLTGKDARILVEACKVVDLALTVNNEQFQAFEWLFISDNGDIVYNTEAVESEKDTMGPQRSGGVLEKLMYSPSIPQNVYQQLETPATPYRGKRRPLLPPRANFNDVPAFLSRVTLAAHEGVYARAEADIEFCKFWILSDLNPTSPSS